MKIKFADLKKAVEYFSYNVRVPADGYLEIVLRDEDLEKHEICSSIVFTLTSSKPAETYDRVKTEKVIVSTLEIFPESENRSARISTQETQDLAD
jgi:hypothetical protein